MTAILRGELSNPPPFPLTQNTNFGNQDVRRGQQINNSSGRRTAQTLWLENLMGRDHSKDLHIDDRIILKWILKK
jgi:hypothetical protein